MAPKPVALVDVDETVCSMVEPWVQIFRERHPTAPIELSSWDTWDIADCVDETYHRSLFDCLDDRLLYERARPIEGALAGVTLLRHMGYRVVFATTATLGHAGAKLMWLRRHGFLKDSNARNDPDYAELRDKALLNADVLIDDRPRNCKEFVEAGVYQRYAILYQPRNIIKTYEKPGHVYRALTWQDVVQAAANLKEFRLS